MKNDTISLEENKAIIEFDAIPDELKGMDNLVLWKWELRGGKLTKIPYDARKLKHAPDHVVSARQSEVSKNSFFL